MHVNYFSPWFVYPFIYHKFRQFCNQLISEIFSPVLMISWPLAIVTANRKSSSHRFDKKKKKKKIPAIFSFSFFWIWIHTHILIVIQQQQLHYFLDDLVYLHLSTYCPAYVLYPTGKRSHYNINVNTIAIFLMLGSLASSWEGNHCVCMCQNLHKLT